MTAFRSILDGRPLTEAEVREIDERVDRVRRDVQAGRPERSPVSTADPRDVREHRADQQRGAERKPDAWRQVMEAHGFRWLEPSELNAHPDVGPMTHVPTSIPDIEGDFPNSALYFSKRHEEGQWRNDLSEGPARVGGADLPGVPEPLKFAFTLADLITGFGAPPGGPETFDAWIRERVTEWRAAASGIVLPKRSLRR